MSKHAMEAYAEKLARKMRGYVQDGVDVGMGQAFYEGVFGYAKGLLLDMAAFAKRRAKRNAIKRSEDFSLAG